MNPKCLLLNQKGLRAQILERLQGLEVTRSAHPVHMTKDKKFIFIPTVIKIFVNKRLEKETIYPPCNVNTFTAIVDLSRSNFSIARAPLFQLKSAM